MRRRLIWGVLILGALIFALEGGEYSTLDIVRQHRRLTALALLADSLQHATDSLTRAERQVRTDPVTQERIAREEFGMVRGNEILYRFLPDSAATKP
ncbi:MAG: septum formation initiator family protein [Gemmatimonadota bacterium]|nr:septum formation initiator family protein [Gemmatimonadota bacterium]